MSRGFRIEHDLPRIEALARSLHTELDVGAASALGRYVELVARWNEKLDLTAAKDADAQVEVLLADALVLARADIIAHGSRCVDVGAGAGAPALPVALLRPDLDVTLVEPLRKRVAFLRTAIGSLGLSSRTRVLEQKLDVDAPTLPGQPYDCAWSRATLAPELWCQLGSGLAARTLVLLAKQTAPNPPEGSVLAHVVEYELTRPGNSAQRSIAMYERP